MIPFNLKVAMRDQDPRSDLKAPRAPVKFEPRERDLIGQFKAIVGKAESLLNTEPVEPKKKRNQNTNVEVKKGTNKRTFSETGSNKRSRSSQSGSAANADPAVVSASTVESVLESEDQRLAVEVVVDDDGLKLANFDSSRRAGSPFRAEGRPASPFGSKMGAHTTAWIVHQDALRRKLVGKTPAESIAYISLIAKKEFESNEELVIIMKDRSDLLSFSDESQYRLNDSYETLKKSLSAAEENDSDPLALQSLIVDYFSFVNLMPGVTLNAVNTDGRGEGKAREILNASERQLGISEDDRVRLRKFVHEIGDTNSKASSAEENTGRFPKLSDSDLSRVMTEFPHIRQPKETYEWQDFDREGVKDSIKKLFDLDSRAIDRDTDADEIVTAIWKRHTDSIEKAYPLSYERVKSGLRKPSLGK